MSRSRITTCLTPFKKGEQIVAIVYNGKWTEEKDYWHFQLDTSIFQTGITASGGFPLIYRQDRITKDGFIIGWNSDDIALYTPTKKAIKSTEDLEYILGGVS
jgi:hypothetical protein